MRGDAGGAFWPVSVRVAARRFRWRRRWPVRGGRGGAAVSGGMAGVLTAVLCLASVSAFAAELPRTPDGRPDLHGVWTNSSITVLERQDASLPLVLTPEQVARIESRRSAQNAAAAAPTDPETGAPPLGGAVGGYNAFWIDRGAQVGRVDGEARSSWIVDPPDGRIPFSEEGRRRVAAILARRSADGPEGLNPADRCLIGSRGSGGPPMLNNIYNNTYQIVQTPDHVMILVEMMHDARIVRLGAEHRPAVLVQWLGDSVGRWEGDTLVIETRHWKRAQGDYEPIFLSEDAAVTERLTLRAPGELHYAFTVDDPAYYTQPWHGEMTFTPAEGPVFEYACHEGNYAMPGILAGARREERER
jgi:hypothetical protein